MHKQLEAAGIDATLILDSAVGYIMEQVDIVMFGAEGVTESGGIINKVHTTVFVNANVLKRLKTSAKANPKCAGFIILAVAVG